jgi:hypothetical protein
MNQKNVLVRRRLRLEEVALHGKTGRNNPLVNQAVLLCREYVLANRKVVGVAVDEFEREHEPIRVVTKQNRRGYAE